MKIGIVNDSAMAVETMRRILATAPEHQVLWIARNGAEAVACCAETKVDIVLMDLVMPVMNGVEATRRIMRYTPCPILVVTSTVTGHSAKVFEAMGAGALDVVATPTFGLEGQRALLEKIARIGMLTGNAGPKKTAKPGPAASAAPQTRDCLLAIGSSTGGPQALVQVLSYLPADFPAAVVVIQHMDVAFSAGLVRWLGSQIDLPVRGVAEGNRPQRGVVLVPSTNGHVVLNANGTLSFTREPANNFYHPSADVFFHSIVQNWRGNGIGLLLTGMGRDGAEGLLALRQRGWHTIAQDEASSVVYGMPKAAAELEAAREILPLCSIGPSIVDQMAPKGIYHGCKRKSV